jgi:hypothetical protein
VKVYLSEAGARIVPIYAAWGKTDKADEWKAKLGLTDQPEFVFARP